MLCNIYCNDASQFDALYADILASDRCRVFIEFSLISRSLQIKKFKITLFMV